MRILLLLVSAIISIHGKKWDAIQGMEETVKGYYSTAQNVMQSMEDILTNSTLEAASFIIAVEDLSIVKEANSISDGERCKQNLVSLKDLKNSFRTHFSQLQGPIIKRISEINGRFREVFASIVVYQDLAEGKWWACKLMGSDCLAETEKWAEESMETLACKVITDCKKRTLIVKREVREKCRNGEFLGDDKQCRDMNHYVCDGSCNQYSNCIDEPSGCSRYCVGGYHCWNLKCLEKSQVCDGVDDCGDGSDEEDCRPREIPPTNCSLEAGKFLCSDRTKCIDLHSTCDGQPDCDDSSDEGGHCGVADCGFECSSAGGVCLTTPRGALCLSSCPPGTSETPTGCSAEPALPPATIAGLLDDVTRLTTRYLTGFKLLQSRLVDQLAGSLSRVAACRGDGLSSIVRLGSYVTTTTQAPHTTTKHHTTTHRTTTHREEPVTEVEGLFADPFEDDY